MAWILLALTACQAPEHDLIRLAELRAETQAGEDPQTVLESVQVGAEPRVVPVDLSGARIDRLTLVAQGDAPTVDLGWKLASERRLSRFRKLTVPLVADGEEHRYTVDLSQEPYWIGTIDRLQLVVPEGSLQVVELLAHPGGTARTAALDGLSMPSLPGLAHLELELPADAPRRAVFEVHLGLAPQFDRPGAKVRFRVRAGSKERQEVWLDEVIEGGGERRWKRVAHEVDMPHGTHPQGARLTLEVEAARHGQPLPEGAAMWGAPTLAPAQEGAEPDGPHLVVLAIDTLRADVLGAYGSTDGLTPALDRLAARSVRFADLEAPSSWTLPSMASLLTGLQPQTHDTGRTLGDEDFAPTALSPAMPTLAGVLAGQGFTTLGVYNNIFLGPSFGVSRGFDLYHWIEEEDDVLVDRAIELLRRYRSDRRMFLMLHLFGPHNPYAPPGDACAVAQRLMPERGDGECSADRRPGTPVPPEDDWAWIEALYKAEVAFTDRQVGRFLDALEEMDLADEVVLLVVSDHGEDFWGRLEEMEELGGYEDADHGHALYRELLHVPGLLHAPGVTPGVIEDPVELVDFFPTLLTLLGIEESAGDSEGGDASGEESSEERASLRDVLQGEDLAPVLGDRSLRPSRRTRVADFLLYGASRRSIRRGPWKLIVPTGSTSVGRDATLSSELYNLEDDPRERENRFETHADVVEQLRQIGEQEMARRQELRLQLQAGQDALHAAHLQWNHITKLRALGYLK